MRKLRRIALAILILFVPLHDTKGKSGKELLDYFDIRYYHPENYGLKDLVFEVRISSLLEMLNKKLSLGKIKDIYFKVYWVLLEDGYGKYEIRIKGLPNGFRQIKNDLKNLIKTRLDFVIPQKMAPKIRAYSLETRQQGSDILLKAIDKTHIKDVSEIHMMFDKTGKLKEFKTLSPEGVKIATMSMGPKSWSHNKWVVDRLSVKSVLGLQTTTTTSDIEYISVAGHGFPKIINLKTTQEITSDKKMGEKTNKRTLNSNLKFSKYEINSGKALKAIIRGKKYE